jgi:hypothetical protein
VWSKNLQYINHFFSVVQEFSVTHYTRNQGTAVHKSVNIKATRRFGTKLRALLNTELDGSVWKPSHLVTFPVAKRHQNLLIRKTCNKKRAWCRTKFLFLLGWNTFNVTSSHFNCCVIAVLTLHTDYKKVYVMCNN